MLEYPIAAIKYLNSNDRLPAELVVQLVRALIQSEVVGSNSNFLHRASKPRELEAQQSSLQHSKNNIIPFLNKIQLTQTCQCLHWQHYHPQTRHQSQRLH